MKKRVVNMYLREDQIAALKQLNAQTGASVAEIVRRAIDKYLVRDGKKQ